MSSRGAAQLAALVLGGLVGGLAVAVLAAVRKGHYPL